MLLDPETLDLLPACGAALERLDDARFSSELPAAQLELVSPVCPHADDLAAALVAARRTAVERLDGFARLAGAGAHPFAAPEGAASADARYIALSERYQWAARRAMTCGVHVHVAVPGCDRALAVHDALRAHLPELAALAGNAPFHEGRDTGLHSVRPKLCESLPRQGIPPPLESWAAYRELLAWGAAGDAFCASEVWWEVRLHPVHGTVEIRVCDQPATAAASATLAAVIQALCAWLSVRHDAGKLGTPAPTVRIQENRWRALRHGLDGTFLDLDTGHPEPARERAARGAADHPRAGGRRPGLERGVRRSLDHPRGHRQRSAAHGGRGGGRRPARRRGGPCDTSRGRGARSDAGLGRQLSRPHRPLVHQGRVTPLGAAWAEQLEDTEPV